MKSKNLIAVVVVIMFFFINRYCAFSARHTLNTISSCLMYPVLKVQHLIVEPVQIWFCERKMMNNLRNAHQQLKDEYELLCAENIALKSMLNYVKETEELLLFKTRYSQKNSVIAQVLVRHLSDQRQFFLVNAGENKGIKKDMLALYQNDLVGKVEEVYPWYCKVCLITDSDCKVAAMCLASEAQGVVEGANNEEKIVMRHVSHLRQLQPSDLVVSNGEGLIFPRGFGLGTIINIEKGDLVYSIDIKPLLDFHSLRYCTLISRNDIEGGGN